MKLEDSSEEFHKVFLTISQNSSKTSVLKSLFNKVAGLMMCNFFKKKNSGTGFSCKFAKIFKKTYFVEHSRTDAWVKWTKKIVFTKSIHTKKEMTPFLVQLQTCGWAYSFSKKGLHHRYFSVKIGKFYRTSVLQNNAVRLLLISCDSFNVLLALPVRNQFSHSMEK